MEGIRLRFFKDLEDLFGGVGGAEGLADGAVVEELGDGGQSTEMGLKLVLGDDEEDDEADGGVVEGLELDAMGGAAKGGDDAAHAVRRGVRDGDAKADAGAHGLLAGAEGAEDGLLVARPDFVLGNEEFDQLHDGAPPLGGFHFGKYLFNRQEVAKIHACCLMLNVREGSCLRVGDCNNGHRVDKRDLEGSGRGILNRRPQRPQRGRKERRAVDRLTISPYDDAMRTIVDFPSEQIKALDGYRKKEGISRAEAVRRAVASFLPPKPGKRFDFRKDPAFGSSKGSLKQDSAELVRALREEWTR